MVSEKTKWIIGIIVALLTVIIPITINLYADYSRPDIPWRTDLGFLQENQGIRVVVESGSDKSERVSVTIISDKFKLENTGYIQPSLKGDNYLVYPIDLTAGKSDWVDFTVRSHNSSAANITIKVEKILLNYIPAPRGEKTYCCEYYKPTWYASQQVYRCNLTYSR